jgi:hypothetical protein
VEEAARIIRVGRTKAYAMTQEWRATNGRSGLPVVDFGNVLRVPRKALEQLVGAELAAVAARDEPRTSPGPSRRVLEEDAPVDHGTPRVETAASTGASRARRPRRHRAQPDTQLHLLPPQPPAT